MRSTSQCEQCGARLPSGLLGNRCPRCLLESALADAEEPENDQGKSPAGQAAVSLPPGRRRFGDYELLGEVGRGGMGVVYKARQLSLHRIVAIKMLLSGPFASQDFVRRFQAEAEAAANLHHPNIVAIHDFGECEGQNYFCMDYVPGRNLAEVIRDKPLDAHTAARHVQLVASAIHSAHEQGILHRDLKPSNIIIDAEDEPRITDFGLAKRLTLEDDMTLTGQAIGSPNYMPPEQAVGDKNAIGPASDIFSLGAILYHLLTGRPPFLAETVTQTLRQVQEAEPVAPRLINPTVPRDLEIICLKCLEKDPRRRFRTAQDLAKELERYRRGEPILTRPVGRPERVWRWCRRNPRLAAVTGALIILGLTLLAGAPWTVVRIDRERKAALATLYRFEIQRAEDLFANDRAPEGVALLASLLRQKSNDMAVAEWLMNELTSRSFALPAIEPLHLNDMVFFTQFSPDGKRLLTVSRDNSARLWDPTTGQPMTPPLQHDPSLVHPGEFLGPTRPLFARFSPDGTRVVTASRDRTARVWDAATGQPLTPPLPHDVEVTCAQFTWDGNQIVTGGRNGSVRFWDLVSSQSPGPLLQHADEVNTIEFSPDGQWLITASQDGTAQVWERRTGQPVGQRLRHAKQVRAASFSPDGRKVITISGDYTARLWHAATGEPATPPLAHEGVVNSAHFSPDGLWVVTSSFDQTARVWEVETGQRIGPPLQHHGTVRSAQFSPDGLRVVTASEDGTARLWEARTGRPVTEPIRHQGAVWWAAFAPDGWRVATACLDKSAQIWDVRLRRALCSRDLLATAPNTAQWSPNGQSLLWGLGTDQARCYDVPGGHLHQRWRVIRPSEPQLRVVRYSQDGQCVIIAGEGQRAQLCDAQTGRALTEALPHDGVIYDAQFSPDGQWVITASADHTARLWSVKTGKLRFAPLRHPDVVHAAQFSPDGRCVVTAGADGQARIWDAATGTAPAPSLQHPAPVVLVSYSPDGQRILTVAEDNTARLWSALSRTALGQPLTHNGLINSARFSPDGRRIVTAARDYTARVWDGQTGRPTTEPLVHEANVVLADFSPDGQRVYTASDDATVRLWDARTGSPRTGPFRQKKGIRTAHISPDGRWLAIGCADWTLSVVEVVSTISAADLSCLPELAEAGVGQKVNAERRFEHLPSHALFEVRSRLAKTAPVQGGLTWANWFLADPARRPTSPAAARSTEWLLDSHLDSAFYDRRVDLEPVEEAVQVTPNNGIIYAQLARLWAQYGPTNGTSRLVRVEWLSRRAIELAPDDPVAWWARAVYFELRGDLEAAVAAMERGSQLGSNNVYFWRAKASLLEKAGRIEAALDAIDEFKRVAQREWGSSFTNSTFVDDWAGFQERHGRPDEARLARLQAQGVNPRDARTPARLIDLWPAYNSGPGTAVALNESGLDLVALPQGRQELAGIEFDIRGLVRLGSASLTSRSRHWPRQVEGIPVHQLCRRLHWLHAADVGEAEGTRIGSYVLHRADGSQLELPIIYGQELLAWHLDSPRTNSRPVVAWKGLTRTREPVQLYMTTWENPQPEVGVETIDFLVTGAKAAPFLVAITADP